MGIDKKIIVFILVWILFDVLTVSYLIRTDRNLLKFADFVIDDNLKNVVQSGGSTFYVVDMMKVNSPAYGAGVDFRMPVYVNGNELDKLIDQARNYSIMLKEFEELDITSKQISAQADQYFKRKLIDTQERNEKQ